jgi:GTPase Era involved in 16S rRNA processing
MRAFNGQIGGGSIYDRGARTVQKGQEFSSYSFLPNCDAVLFVTSAEGPLSEAEIELLTAIKRYAGKIFFVLNKIDLLADESEDMEGFALKREATRRHLVGEDEEDAYLRAIVHFAGAKDNCTPWTCRKEF